MESIHQLLHALLLWFLFPGLELIVFLKPLLRLYSQNAPVEMLWTTQLHSQLRAVSDEEHWIRPAFFFLFNLFFQVRWVASASSVDFIFHPAAPTAAAPTLSFGALVNVIGDEAALPLRARHIFVIVALGVLGRKAGVLCLRVCRRARVQFGNDAKGVRSLYGVRRDSTPLLWFRSAGVGLFFSPRWDGKVIMVKMNPTEQEMLMNELLLYKMSNSKDRAA